MVALAFVWRSRGTALLAALLGAGCGGGASQASSYQDKGPAREDASSGSKDAGRVPAEAGTVSSPMDASAPPTQDASPSPQASMADSSTAQASMPEPSPEASAPDAPTEAGPRCMTNGTVSDDGMGSCSVDITAMCGADSYQVTCQCPDATCSCLSSPAMGTGTTVVVPYPACPACPDATQALRLCGVPQ